MGRWRRQLATTDWANEVSMSWRPTGSAPGHASNPGPRGVRRGTHGSGETSAWFSSTLRASLDPYSHGDPDDRLVEWDA